jgi:protein SCO1/2
MTAAVPQLSTPTTLALVAGAAFVIGGGAALLSVTGLPGGDGTRPAVSTTGTALVGGPFRLVDHTGKRVTDADYKGRYLLVFFGFTHCPDICPTGLQVMSAALDQIGSKAERLRPVFITVDPERDTPDKLGQYVKAFHPSLIGLTGSIEEIANVAKAYRVYFKKVANGPKPDDYTMDHTSIIYLMNPDGSYLTHFTHATPTDTLAARLAKLP